MVSTGGGGPSIDSPEQAIIAVVLIAIAGLVWWLKFSD